MDTSKSVRLTVALITPAVIAGGLVMVSAPAQASSAPIKRFANCTAMHQVPAYRGGIKRVGAHDHRTSGVARYAPYVSTKRYTLNAGSDRDKDGVACEA